MAKPDEQPNGIICDDSHGVRGGGGRGPDEAVGFAGAVGFLCEVGCVLLACWAAWNYRPAAVALVAGTAFYLGWHRGHKDRRKQEAHDAADRS